MRSMALFGDAGGAKDFRPGEDGDRRCWYRHGRNKAALRGRPSWKTEDGFISSADANLPIDFLPGGGHRLGEVVPDHFQQTKTAFREVEKNADDIVLSSQTYP
jgi:hypothetical protein